jgi:putative hydrolase of the HAD superfamily
MGIRAVVFDYGMVLSGPPGKIARAELLRITGMTEDDFEALYWKDRHAYDRGDLNGMQFWRKFVQDAGLALEDNLLSELNRWDARMWTSENTAMVRWQKRLRSEGFTTAILSNMGDSVLENIERELEWVQDFDIHVWSYRHGCAKPEPNIYHLLLQRLATAPEETLFLDDKQINVEAARKFGMQAIPFSNTDQLRQDMISMKLDEELPLPE